MATKRTNRKADTKNRRADSSRDRIIDLFAKAWSEEGEQPKSIAKFCKEAGISQAAFYAKFSSLRAVEKAFWKSWIEGLVSALESGKEWKDFSARERYLAFLFTLLQSSLERREMLRERFEGLATVANPQVLEGLRSAFLEFAEGIVKHGCSTGEIADRKQLLKLYPGILYIHLRLVIDRHLDDESEEFQRTDAFVEKTVALAFDLFRSQALDSAVDLVRFLVPESPWAWIRGGKE